ncbi:MAG TPA: GDSL-type esterase/lipase family protein [Myxococcota bacterium]
MFAAAALLIALSVPAPAAPTDDDETRALRAFAARLRAPGAPLDNPAALGGFFAALDHADTDRVAVAFFGNSLIAVDRIVDVFRARLVDVAGDGGRGFLLADRLADYGPRTRTARAANGWSVCTLGDVTPVPASRGVPFGVAGVVHVADHAGARSVFAVDDDDDVATVYATVAPGRGGLRARFDDEPWFVVADRLDGDDERVIDIVRSLRVPAGAKRLELQATGARAIVHGVALERDASDGGVVVDTLGVPAIDATLWLGTDEGTLTAQLSSRQPDLAVIMLGGNETKRLAWRRRDLDDIDADLRAFIRRTRVVDGTACLVVGPIDAVVGGDGADPFRQRPQLALVNERFASVAHDEGCAYFDLYAAMGGRGALERLHELGALHDDLVHPRGRGLDVLGHLLAEALLTSWRPLSVPP